MGKNLPGFIDSVVVSDQIIRLKFKAMRVMTSLIVFRYSLQIVTGKFLCHLLGDRLDTFLYMPFTFRLLWKKCYRQINFEYDINCWVNINC